MAVVVRPTIELAASASAVLESMAPSLISTASVTAWPGTVLEWGEATEHRFHVNDVSVQVVIRAASGLYSWEQPYLPEDLSFTRSTGETLLATIAHENDAYLLLTPQERTTLSRTHQRLDGLLSSEPDSDSD